MLKIGHLIALKCELLSSQIRGTFEVVYIRTRNRRRQFSFLNANKKLILNLITVNGFVTTSWA